MYAIRSYYAVQGVIDHPGIGVGGLQIGAGGAEQAEGRPLHGYAHMGQPRIDADHQIGPADEGGGQTQAGLSRQIA